MAANGLTWHVRPPKAWNRSKPGPALLLLHGSNMSSKSYVLSVAHAWPKLAEDFALVGIDGEQRVPGSPDDAPAFNYTYVNWGGRSKYPGTQARESPPLVVEALAEIRKALPLSKVLVGGHSQGGFLSYLLFLNYPETFAGAFPISCGLVVQAEPTAFEDAALRAEQRRGALAIVHAQDDPVVSFSSGDAAYGAFLDDAFPALTFFAPKTGAHMFMRLPIEEAVRRLDAQTSDDPKALAAFLRERVEAKAWRDVWAAAERLKRLDAKRQHVGAADAALKAREAAATTAAAPLRKAMAAKDDSWVEAFVAFRHDFEGAAAAKPITSLYTDRREAQRKEAEKLWAEARAAWGRDDAAAAEAACRTLMSRCPASLQYRWARNALKKA